MLRLLSGEMAEVCFRGDDVLSVGALGALRTAGLRVAQEVGRIGLNDMEMARRGNINPTTIHQPFPQIAAASIDLIVQLPENPGRCAESRPFPCSVVERGNLRPPLAPVRSVGPEAVAPRRSRRRLPWPRRQPHGWP